MDDDDGLSRFQLCQLITLLGSFIILLGGIFTQVQSQKAILWLLIPVMGMNIGLTIYAINKNGTDEAFSYIERWLSMEKRGPKGGGPK